MSVSSIERRIRKIEREINDLEFKKKTTRIPDELKILQMSIDGLKKNLVEQKAKLITAKAKANLKDKKK